jgi:G:T-mismatch repair DNA endonuclease (very short patch repair protein)
LNSFQTDGIIYRRQKRNEPQLVVLVLLAKEVITLHHDSVFAAHPCRKKTFQLIYSNYWWPKMRQSIDDYVMGCDA